jgi:hydrogenase maturation protease
LFFSARPADIKYILKKQTDKIFLHIQDLIINGSVAVMGVGNPDKGDDGIGPHIADTLIRRGFKNIYNCEEVPENFIVKVCSHSPVNIIIIDAVYLNAPPGTVDILNCDTLAGGITTHNAGLDMLCDFIKSECNANIFIIAVQPAGLTGCMSQEVTEAGEMIVEKIGELLCMNRTKPAK